MNKLRKTYLFTGILYLSVFALGILSIAPAIDHPEYLVKAAGNASEIYKSTTAQSTMVIVYMLIALLLFPSLKKGSRFLAVSYIGFRILAVICLTASVFSMLNLLELSQNFVAQGSANLDYFQKLGNALQRERDLFNHVGMIISLCISNVLMNIILFRFRLIPRWLSSWGLAGAGFAICASLLILLNYLKVLSSTYMLLNVPTGLQEVVFAFWLIFTGLKTPKDII